MGSRRPNCIILEDTDGATGMLCSWFAGIRQDICGVHVSAARCSGCGCYK